MKKEQLAFNFWCCVLWSEKYGQLTLDHIFGLQRGGSKSFSFSFMFNQNVFILKLHKNALNS